jgi:hypothetical protein
MDHKALRRRYEAAGRDGNERIFYSDLREALKEKQLTPQDFSIARLFEEFVEDGYSLRRQFNPAYHDGANLLEAGGPVVSTAFANITGQIFFSTVMAAFDDPVLIWKDLCTVKPTSFDGEKIPGISGIGDEAETIGEAKPYPYAGVSESWVETPSTIKRGFIIGVTKEAVFFDQTGLLLDRVSRVAQSMAINKEKRIVDVAIGASDIYSRNGNTGIAVYGDNSGTHDWDNLRAGCALTDWTDIEEAELLFDGLTDPDTGEPINVIPDTIIVATAKKHTARQITNATLQHVDTASAVYRTTYAPQMNQYKVLTNQYVGVRLAADSGLNTTWYIGQPKKAFAYMENWGPTVQISNENSEASFTHDIVTRYKISERGAAAIVEPRYMVKCTAA